MTLPVRCAWESSAALELLWLVARGTMVGVAADLYTKRNIFLHQKQPSFQIAKYWLTFYCELGTMWDKEIASLVLSLRKLSWRVMALQSQLATRTCTCTGSRHVTWFCSIKTLYVSSFNLNTSSSTWRTSSHLSCCSVTLQSKVWVANMRSRLFWFSSGVVTKS